MGVPCVPVNGIVPKSCLKRCSQECSVGAFGSIVADGDKGVDHAVEVNVSERYLKNTFKFYLLRLKQGVRWRGGWGGFSPPTFLPKSYCVTSP